MNKLLLAAVATLTVAEFAAGEVRYAINGGTSLLLPTNRIITVGTITDAMLLHIFDATGNVDDSVSEQIVVRGSATSGGSIRVQVASAAEGDAFEFDPRRSLAAGLRNFGGIRFENATNSSDTSLRDHAVVAVAVAGDVTGAIDAGQIFRVDALAYEDSEEQLQGGRILGDITAHNLDSSIIDNSSPVLSGGVGAIAYVRAGREISGNITATGTDAFDAGSRANYASIGRVVVGPVESATGIQGNIKAERGSIGSIFTVGPIGADATGSSAARTPQIYAGDTIIEILAADEDSVAAFEPEYRAVNFRADVRADVAAYATDGFVFQEGALLLLRTDGDVSGTGIHAGNICQPFEPEVPTSLSALVVGSSTGQVGIYARGTVRVPITIDHIVQGNIIAKTFTEPIIIGRMLEGAVIAWSGLGGGTDGDATLNALRIGLDEPPDSPTGSPTYAYDGKWSKCFTGKDSGCFPSLTGPDPGDPDSINPNVDAYYQNLAQTCEEGAGPSVVAANHAGSIAISRMTVWETERGTSVDGPDVYSHPAVPTIECQRIDTLHIDELREGAVWSGLFDGSGSLGDGSDAHANTVRTDDYARAGEVSIGCMGDVPRCG